MRSFHEITWKGKKVGAMSMIVSKDDGVYEQGFMLSTGDTITLKEYEDGRKLQQPEIENDEKPRV